MMFILTGEQWGTKLVQSFVLEKQKNLHLLRNLKMLLPFELVITLLKGNPTMIILKSVQQNKTKRNRKEGIKELSLFLNNQKHSYC